MRYIKVGETDSTKLRAYFDVRLIDNVSPALSEAGGQPEYNINGGSFNPVGIGVLVAVSYGRYYAQLSSTVITTPGDVIRTRYKGSLTSETFGDSFTVTSSTGTLPDGAISITHYGTLVGGDLYFANSLTGRQWKRKSPDEKYRALVDATHLIDILNFSGEKADSMQVLQFPRKNSYLDPFTRTATITSDVNVPDDIQVATYIVADKLLDGWDPDMEADVSAVQSQKYNGASTMYAREYVPEHMRAGIPSAKAWALIRPYVREPQEVELTRM